MAPSIPEKDRQESPESDPAKDTEKGESDNGVVADPNEGLSEKEKNAYHRKSSIPPKVAEDGRRIITEEECWDSLGYSWPTWKKWMLLSSIFIVQVSMNFNTSVFPSAIEGMAHYWQISEQIARLGQMIFLVFYAFGCELWAPWSEEFGRWPVLQ